MWDFLDFVARLILLGGIALIWYFLYQITREPSARACVCCGSALSEYDLANCYRCLAVSDV